jgi:hypothetical protein
MQESGDLRLIDFERHRNFSLGKSAPLHNPVDGSSEAGFRVELVGIRQSHIRKDIAAARYHSLCGPLSHTSPRNPAAECLPPYCAALRAKPTLRWTSDGNRVMSLSEEPIQ